MGSGKKRVRCCAWLARGWVAGCLEAGILMALVPRAESGKETASTSGKDGPDESAPGKFECRQCGRTFGTKRQLHAHERAHLTELVSCSKCMAKFTTKRTLVVHTRSVHGAERIKCLVKNCPIQFSRTDNMRAHMRTYHPGATLKLKHVLIKGGEARGAAGDSPIDKGDDEFVVRHQCHICQKNYSTRSYLLMHIQNAHEGKSYECPECDKVFNSRGYFHRHFAAAHAAPAMTGDGRDAASDDADRTPEAVYKCDKCNRNFAKPASMAIHRFSMHGIPLPAGVFRPSAGGASGSAAVRKETL